MKIRYKKTAAFLSIIASALFLLTAFISIATDYEPLDLLNLATGIFFLILGVFYLKNPYFEIREKKLVIYKPYAGVRRTYTLNSFQDLTIENNKIYLKKGNKKEKLPVYKSLVESGDWQALAERIKE